GRWSAAPGPSRKVIFMLAPLDGVGLATGAPRHENAAVAVRSGRCDRQAMPPGQPPRAPARLSRSSRFRTAALAALLLPMPAWAQDTGGQPDVEVPEAGARGEREIAFEATSVSYDGDTDTVTASGDVLLSSEDQSVRADNVAWNRQTGQIVATGNIRFVDEDGNQLFTDRLELTDELKAGAKIGRAHV